MLVPTSTMRFAPERRAVTARNDATSGSLIGWRLSRAYCSISWRSASRGVSMLSRYAACAGFRIESDASFTASLLSRGLHFDDVVMHRAELRHEIRLRVAGDVVLVERGLQIGDECVPFVLLDLHA